MAEITKPVINIADVPLRDNGARRQVRGEDRLASAA